jgi:hypothetical protein
MEEEIIQKAEEEKEGSHSSEKKEQKKEEEIVKKAEKEKEGNNNSEEKEESESEFKKDGDSSDEEGGYDSNSDTEEDEVEDIYVKEEEESESEFEVDGDSSDEEGGYDSNSMDEDELEDEIDFPYALEIRKSSKFKKPIQYNEFRSIQEIIDDFCLNQIRLGEQVPYLKVLFWKYDDESKAGYAACVDEATREWIRNYLQNIVICGKKYRAWRMDEHDKILIKINIHGDAAIAFKESDCFMKYVIASEKEKIPQNSYFEICGSKKLGPNRIQHRYIINEDFFYALEQLNYAVYFGTLKFRFRKCIY